MKIYDTILVLVRIFKPRLGVYRATINDWLMLLIKSEGLCKAAILCHAQFTMGPQSNIQIALEKKRLHLY